MSAAMCHSVFLAVAAVMALATYAAAVEPQTSADRFDVARGTVVTSHSAVSSSTAEAMLGQPGGNPEPGVTFFSDAPDAFIHFNQWTAPSAFTLEAFNLRASADSPTLPEQRAFDHFRLQAKVGDDFVTVFESDVAVPNEFVGPDALIFSEVLESPVVASEFRAEFTQHLTGPGPRIYELDGFGGELCGDANDSETINATDALAALRTSVGPTLCLQCICDVDSGGSVVASDALAILRHSVGSLSTLTCSECYLGDDSP